MLFIYLGCDGSSLAHGLVSSCEEQELLFAAALRLLIAKRGLSASVLAACEFSSRGSQTQERMLSRLKGTGLAAPRLWDLLPSDIKPVSPALAGGFTTEPVGPFLKSLLNLLQRCFCFRSCVFLGHKAYEILAPSPGVRSPPLHCKVKWEPLDPQGVPYLCFWPST